MRKVDLPLICGWIVKVCEEMPSDIIKRAYLKCCISNNMDGTEDDIIWEEEVANDGDSDGTCSTLIWTRSYMPSSTRKALMRISSSLAERFHKTQRALFQGHKSTKKCMIPV